MVVLWQLYCNIDITSRKGPKNGGTVRQKQSESSTIWNYYALCCTIWQQIHLVEGLTFENSVVFCWRYWYVTQVLQTISKLSHCHSSSDYWGPAGDIHAMWPTLMTPEPSWSLSSIVFSDILSFYLCPKTLRSNVEVNQAMLIMWHIFPLTPAQCNICSGCLLHAC